VNYINETFRKPSRLYRVCSQLIVNQIASQSRNSHLEKLMAVKNIFILGGCNQRDTIDTAVRYNNNRSHCLYFHHQLSLEFIDCMMPPVTTWIA
jgi:hypothetical protein